MHEKLPSPARHTTTFIATEGCDRLPAATVKFLQVFRFIAVVDFHRAFFFSPDLSFMQGLERLEVCCRKIGCYHNVTSAGSIIWLGSLRAALSGRCPRMSSEPSEKPGEKADPPVPLILLRVRDFAKRRHSHLSNTTSTSYFFRFGKRIRLDILNQIGKVGMQKDRGPCS